MEIYTTHPDYPGETNIILEDQRMKHAVCAVFDKKTATYDNIFNIRHPGEAIRQWDTLRKNPETKFGKNPEDFDLMQIAWYDDSTGTIEQILPHTHLASGV